MVPLSHLLPDVADRETRTIFLFEEEEGEGPPPVPPDGYVFDELYCVERGCDCRRVMINVFSVKTRTHLATINHSFEPPAKGDVVQEQTFLDPLNRQSRWSSPLMDLFLHTVESDPDYRRRLIRHYRLVKDAVADVSSPIHRLIASDPSAPAAEGGARRKSVPRPPPPRGRKRWR
jgi:hypothetical protein